MSAPASTLPFLTAFFLPSPIPAGALSATANASGAFDQATSSAAACLQNGRLRAAMHEQRPRTPLSSNRICTLYVLEPAASAKSLCS